MILDFGSIAHDARVEADLCVVGAGAAGITIARAFAGRDVRVLLLESGGLETEHDIQALYAGEATGTMVPAESGYAVATRLRYFGGTTNHWTGECRPLDPIDFEGRSWVPASGWPMARNALEAYYRGAEALVEVASFDCDLAQHTAVAGPPLLPPDALLETTFWHKSRPTRFSVRYREEIEGASNVTLLLRASVLAVELARGSGQVGELLVGDLHGRRARIAARHFVLATGGIENARLLLVSRSVQEAGVGNGHDLVGRYFMDHPSREIGHVALVNGQRTRQIYDGFTDPRSRRRVMGALRVREETQRAHRLRNAAFFLAGLRRDEVLPELALPVLHLARAMAADGRPAPDHPRHDFFRLSAFVEPSPLAGSRVTLLPERDALGLPRIHLDWRLDPEDASSLWRSAEILAAELGRFGLGRLVLHARPHDTWTGASWGCHHMGTTRMHADPRHGVVDADCRVHGLENLWIAGSSVFPTAGCSNPTLTIVALALRLADRLVASFAG